MPLRKSHKPQRPYEAYQPYEQQYRTAGQAQSESAAAAVAQLWSVGPHLAIAADPPDAPGQALNALGSVSEVKDALLVLVATPDGGPVLRDCLPRLTQIAGERGADRLVLAASGLAAKPASPTGRRPAQRVAATTGLTVVAPDGVVRLSDEGVLRVGGPADAAWWTCPANGEPTLFGPEWPPLEPEWFGPAEWTVESTHAGLWIRPPGPDAALDVPAEIWVQVPSLVSRMAGDWRRKGIWIGFGPPPEIDAYPDGSESEPTIELPDLPLVEPTLELESAFEPDLSPVLEPVPSPVPVRVPVPTPTPEPEPARIAEPVLISEPTPAPEPTSVPEPEPAPIPEPVSDPEPVPTASAVRTASVVPTAFAEPAASVEPVDSIVPVEPVDSAVPTEPAVPKTPTVQRPPVPRRDNCSTEDRNVLRDALGPAYIRLAARTDHVVTRLPGLRTVPRDEVRPELAAVLLHHTDAKQPADREALAAAARAGTTDPVLAAYLSCLTAGLRRLPSHQGMVLLGGHPADGTLDEFTPGIVLHEPAPISALPAEDVYLGAPVEFAVWSTTGHRTNLFGAAGEEPEVVFQPGTSFRVLEVTAASEETNGVTRILLREADPTTHERADELDVRALRRMRPLLDRRSAIPDHELRRIPHPQRVHLSPGLY